MGRRMFHGGARGAVVNAAKSMVEQLEQRMLLAGTITARTPAWVEQGPAPLTDSNLVKLPPFDESNGAVEAIAACTQSHD